MKENHNNQLIRISVVIPCRNEEASIEDCVKSVLNSNYPPELLEVFVCDGMSDDNTLSIVEQMAKSHSNVKLILNKEQTTPHALNLGIKAASGGVILILGAHASLSRDYIAVCAESLERDSSLGCVGGVLDNTYSDMVSESISKAMSHPFGVGSAHFRTGQRSGYVDTVAFGAYRAEIFDEIGLFDEALIRNQDDELNYRLTKAGYNIELNTSIHAVYHVRASFGKLSKQYYQYGYWKVYVNKKHGAVTSFRQIIPTVFILFLVFGLASSIAFPILLTPYLIALGIYIGMGIFSALSSASNPLVICMILFSFLTLHLSYGIGYLQGIVMLQSGSIRPDASKSTTSR